MGARDALPDFDFSHRREGMMGIGEIVGAHRLHQRAGVRPHHTEDGFGRRNVRHHDEQVGCEMAAEPVEVALQRDGGHDQQEGCFRKPRHGQVALDPAARVQPLRIDDAPHLDVDLVG